MYRNVVGIMVLSLFLSFAAACAAPAVPATDTGSGESTAATGGEAAGNGEPKILRIALNELVGNIELDPHQSPFVPALPIMRAAYETLLEYDFETATVTPGLAESWEVSEDGTQITFHLRPGAMFSSGNPVNAEAVVWSLRRPFEQEAYLLYQINGFLNIDSAEVVDDMTVRVTLNQPSAVALAGFTSSPTAVVDPAVMEFDEGGDYGFAYLNSHSMGSGPYMIESVATGERITLVPNPHYNGPTPPQVDQIIAMSVPESSQQMFLLERGDLEIATGLTAQQVDLFREREGYSIVVGEDAAVSYLSMNMGKAPFDDVRVRQAICTAIDYEGIINDLLPNQVFQASGIIPRGLVGYSDDFLIQRDLEKARALLEEAGYGDGFEFSIWVTTDAIRGLSEPETNIGLKLQADLADIGITANVEEQDTDTLFPRYRAGELDSIWWDWSPAFADPDALITPHGDLSTSGGQRTGWGCNPGTTGTGCATDQARPEAVETTELLAQARVELDSAARAELYNAAQKLIVEQGPYCFLFQALSSHAVSEQVTNYSQHPFAVMDLRPVAMQ